jgi:hypothetical protein
MPRVTPTVKQILIVLGAAYVLQLIGENFVGLPLFSWLAMWPGELLPWQLITYVLVDRNHPLMFLLGLLFIAWAMSRFDGAFGRRRTLELSIAVLLSASVPAFVVGTATAPAPPLFGSNPLWLGSIATVCWLEGHRSISLFGVIPMTSRQFLWLLVGLSVLMFLASKNQTQLAGDFGALAGGIGFARYLRRPPRQPRAPRKKTRPSGFQVISGGQDDKKPEWLN